MLKDLFKELSHRLWGLANLQFVGQTGRLETQAAFESWGRIPSS